MRSLSGGRFAATIVWRLAAFVALSLAGPWIATTIQRATECTGTEGACAAISVGTGALLRPLILVLLALALLRPCWRRMKAVGMWGVAGLLVPVLLLLDWRSLTAFGLHYMPVSVGPGAIAGEMAFYLRNPRSASVIAEAPLVAWRLSAAGLRRLAADSPETLARFHHGMAAILADRLAGSNRLVRLLAD